MNLSEHNLYPLHTEAGYRRHFMDVDFWRPYVQLVFEREGLVDAPTVDAGLPGTSPTFQVNGRWVIKFFGREFEGDLSYQTELALNRLTTAAPDIPTPALLGSGLLFPQAIDWPWPYLIMEYISGVSIGEVYEQVSFSDRLGVAEWLGRLTRQLHRLHTVSPEGNSLSLPVRNSYFNLLRDRHWRCTDIHRRAAILPPHLIDQIDAYLLPRDQLLDPAHLTCLIHADLTADHVLGQLSAGRWESQHLIDFGDAMLGDFHYELIALHLDLFRCDKRLLKAYLDAYGLDAEMHRQLSHRAMSLTLLHRFDVLAPFPERFPAAFQVESLTALESLLWDIETEII